MPHKSLRILVVSLAPLDPELGASQIALNLAAALRQLGHDVTCWTPGPRPVAVPWWRSIPWARRELKQVLIERGPFDVVDAPPVLITGRVARLAPRVIARTVQPDLLYLACEVVEALREAARHPLRSMAMIGYSMYLSWLVMIGYHWASKILCLGSREAEWLRKGFPWLKHKIAHYGAAPSSGDRERARQIRALRRPPDGPGTRFLWIGRWAPHKGTRRLLRFMRQWMKTHPYDIFTIAGCGTGALLKVPADLRADGRVRIVPSFSRQELWTLLADHDVGLFTSIVEGWGLALQEMLESGMPVLATPAGGVRDLAPYAGRLLKPFPADGRVSIESPIDRRLPPEYYERFSWLRIAEDYIEFCAL